MHVHMQMRKALLVQYPLYAIPLRIKTRVAHSGRLLLHPVATRRPPERVPFFFVPSTAEHHDPSLQFLNKVEVSKR